MNPQRLAQLEDLTRRYAKYRPCGAGLGVLWGGFLLGLLDGMMLGWLLTGYVSRSNPTENLWRFTRGSNLATPTWLAWAALALPFLAWMGLQGIQAWVDHRFGTVEGLEPSQRFSKWRIPIPLTAMALGMGSLLVMDSPSTFGGWGLAGILTVTAWSFVWARNCRDGLTQSVMLFLSIPPFFLLAGIGAGSHLAGANLTVFGAYTLFMVVLFVRGALRFTGFLKVRRELAALKPVAE